MGNAQRQSGLIDAPVFFLDENHCGNSHLHVVLEEAGVSFEKHLDHFKRGTEDAIWIPQVAANQWVVVTADARIRYNSLERKAVADNKLRLFYFSRNDFSGAELGAILGKALPRMLAICAKEVPPFAASISRSGDVEVRDRFSDADLSHM